MNNRDFDKLVESIRNDVPDGREAAERVRDRLGLASDLDAARSSVCAMFRGSLTAEKKMLLRDHVLTCMDCRREHMGLTNNVVAMPQRGVARRWVMVAAAAVVITGMGLAMPSVLDEVLAPSGARGTVASIEGTLVAISAQGAEPLATGAEIGEGQEIRTGKGSHAVVRLRDGSLVEMDERSSITLAEKWRGKTVRLVRGNVIVEAAKQRSGFLQVATTDAVVSVKGTIFGVSMGLKGSRVSVVEGEVRVDETRGGTALLHRGDQKTTDVSMARTAVTEDLAWSQNATKYIALLADMQSVTEQISRIPMPGLRYSSRLLDRVPLGTTVVIALPNLGSVLGEATQIFENKSRQSAAMAEWWNTSGAAEMREAVSKVQAVSGYLGDEVILAFPEEGDPVLLAETKREGLAAELTRLGFPGSVGIEGNVAAMGAATVPPVGTFVSTPFGAQIRGAYDAGAGLLFSMNLEQMSPRDVDASVAGFDNMRFLIAEQKGTLAAPVHSAKLSFNGARHGLASWLANPGPMGSLEFVSKNATFAASFVTRNPRQMLEELLNQVGAEQTLEEFRTEAGVSLLDDLAGTLGGEATIAMDGALLPVPEWKVAMEVENASRLQWAIEQMVAAVQRNREDAVSLTNETVDGRKFYSLTGMPMVVHYTFVDGYWLVGASRALLMKAISDRAAALTLPRSAEFRAQMPQDGHTFFSGLLYYDMGTTVGPMADQLKASGLLTPELQAQVDTIAANRAPGLVYVYGEPERIQVGSRSNLFQMGLQAIVAGNPMAGLPFAPPAGAK